MKLSRVKIAVLAAVLLLGMIAIPVFAACPPGTIDLSDPGNYGGPGTTRPIAEDAATNNFFIQQAGTYCIPAIGLALGAAGPLTAAAINATAPDVAVAGGSTVDQYTINTQNVAIVGEMPSAILDTVAAAAYVITVNAAANNCTIHNFMIRDQVGGSQAIQANASDCTIEGMKFLETGAGFGDPMIDIAGGQNAIVQNNEFVLPANTAATIIRLAGGQGARILNNLVQGDPTFTTNPAFFVENNFASYNDAEIRGNRVNGGVETFVGPTGLPFNAAASSFTNSVIAGNTAPCDVGIHLGDTTNSTVVQGNMITYGATGTTGFGDIAGEGVGLYDAGGSNNQYLNNNLVASNAATAVGGTALWFLSSNAVIENNVLDARGPGGTFGYGIAAVDVSPPAAGAGATNAVIRNNTIRGTGAPGVGIAMWAAANTNFLVENNTISNCSRLGIVAVDPTNPPLLVGGANHLIRNNTITNTGINAGVGTFTGTAIASNGNNRIENNTITDVKNGVGILTFGGNDKITGNTITSVSGQSGSGIGIWTTAGNALVDGNTIKNVSGPIGDGIAVTVGNCTITNNTIDTVWSGHGIRLYDSGFPAGLGYTSAGNATISGNTVKNVANGVGICLTDNDNNKVTDNMITNTGQEGILLYAAPAFNASPDLVAAGIGWGPLVALASANNNVIQGNTITGAGRNAADVAPALPNPGQRYAAIRLEGNADNNEIDNNEIVDAGSSAGAASYAVGIDLLAGGGQDPDNNDITNNTLSGFTTVAPGAGTSEGIRVLSGQNNTVTGNTVTNTGNMQFGIDIRTVNELPVTDNTVEGMLEAGLYLWGGTAVNPLQVTGNALKDNVTGVWMATGSSDITDCNLILGGATGVYVDPLANAVSFKFNGNCVGACILCRNDGIGQLDATGNYWAATPVAGANVFGNVDTSGALDECPCPGWEGPEPGKSHTYGAVAGWYMVSVPLNSGSASSLFGTVAYRWNCATGVYDIVSMVEPEFGYWVSLPASKSVTDSGSQVTSDVTINISCTGWHQVSAPWSYPKSAIKVLKGADEKTWADAVTAGWVRDDIYAYSATGTDYTMPSTMYPWYGYWVRANVSGLSLKLLYASGTPVSAGFAPMGPKALVVPADLPPMPPSPSVGAADLEFGNYPNPIVDVHTTTFAVKGAMAYLVEAIKVQIFDLAGRLVYEAEEAGTSLDWHTDSDYGEYLANGVYLYKLYALVNGEWVVSETKKLAILR